MASKKQNIRPLWFVSPLVLDEDQTKTRITPEAFNARDQDEQPAAPARRRDQLEVAHRPENTSGYGFGLLRADIVKEAFTSAEAAEEVAKERASKQPKTAFGVFACVEVFETTQPEIIEKRFNSAGELTLVSKEKDNAITQEV